MEKIKAMISLIIPLFVSAFQRAIDLADAMEARGYIPDRKRTRYHQLKMKLADYLMLVVCLGVLACAIMLQLM
jgi:energy-coupling factor transport system permease protein